MTAAVVPAVNSKWAIEDVPTPEPGGNQVLIKIHASGMCYTDVHQTAGELPGPFPRVLGHEPLGEIVTVGPGVRTRRVGDRVGVPWVQVSCGRPDGRFVLMGLEVKPLALSAADFIMKRIHLIGSRQNGREYLYEALDYVAKGKVKNVAETYSLNEINKAYERVVEGKVRFRAVLTN